MKIATPINNKGYTALWGGLAFSLLMVLVIGWANQFVADTPLLPDQGTWWYYWKLPEPTLITRLSVWSLYTLHQVIFWGLIYFAQTRVKTYTSGLHAINIWALGINAAFIGLHLIQTQLFYDGLAQDVPEWSSQWSVILMLVWVLLMENSRRGMFFGKKLPISKEIIRFARKYHGYLFAWATVYTFWFHPTISTPGHLIGFFYMFMLLLQGSLFLTRLHTNKWWTLVQEVTVLAHGAIVAYFQGNNLWPMFAFGFGGIFVVTQMYGLGLPGWVKAVVTALYIGLAILSYSLVGGIAKIYQITFIPLTEYGVVIALALLIGGGLWLTRRFKGEHHVAPLASEAD